VIGLGGFLGANARYLIAGWATRRFGAAFPYGTFLINLSGSFLLGLLLAFLRERIFLHPYHFLFFAVGFLSAYTTFSTFTYESLRLLQDGSVFLPGGRVVIAEESDVCHKGDRGPRGPLEGTTGREGKPWTPARGFAVRMGRAPPAANGAEAI